MEEGTILWYDAQKGYGFITRTDGSTIFFHNKKVLDGLQKIEPGQKVVYSVGNVPRGLEAVDVIRTELEPLSCFSGTVREFSEVKGYGFLITETGRSIFFHATDVEGFTPENGMRVSFQIGHNDRIDQPKAINIKGE